MLGFEVNWNEGLAKYYYWIFGVTFLSPGCLTIVCLRRILMGHGVSWTIVSHRNFHQDEAWAILFLKKYGDSKYPGVATAEVEFVDDPQSVNGLELVAQRRICIGCGGGLYDEHNRDRQTCCAELVASHLGLMANRAISNIIEYVRHCDRTPDVRPQELPSLIKQWHK